MITVNFEDCQKYRVLKTCEGAHPKVCLFLRLSMAEKNRKLQIIFETLRCPKYGC